MTPSKEQLLFRLIYTTGFGPVAVRYILDASYKQGITLPELYSLSVDDIKNYYPELPIHAFIGIGDVELLRKYDEHIEHSYDLCKENGVSLIDIYDEFYPELLRKNVKENAPPYLFLKGEIALLENKGIAVIGSRNAGDKTIAIAQRLASEISECGYQIISGNAKGIDSAAHRGAVGTNGGKTILTLSYGFEHLRMSEELQSQLRTENHLFLSQFLPHERFAGYRAMARNTTVVGLAEAVVVIITGAEKTADGRSTGTFNAARQAMAMGVPVYVFDPEQLEEPNANRDLIKLGALKFDSVSGIVAPHVS